MARVDSEEDAAEAAEAAEAAAEQEKEEEFEAVVAKCNLNAKLDSKMYPQVKDIFFDLCDNDKFMEACFASLMVCSRRGEWYARDAMDVMQKRYMERS
jgi:hypothetical protein